MVTLRIEGMHCAACVRRLTAKLQALPGTQVRAVEVGRACLDTPATDEELRATVEAAGFSAAVQRT